MGKKKLTRWAELGTFRNVVQPLTDIKIGDNYPVKGNWNRDIFKNNNPVILELGCGKGEYTIGLSQRFPGKNFIGVDIKGARMWRGAKTAAENKMNNAAFLRTRIEFITSFFGENEVDEIWITFPDPHNGKKNSNKRLTCPWFLNKYREFLKNKGVIHLKTDNSDLFRYTKKIAEKNNLEILFFTADLHSEKKDDDILTIRTHYENMFLKEGLKINYLSFRLDKNKMVEDDFAGEKR